MRCRGRCRIECSVEGVITLVEGDVIGVTLYGKDELVGKHVSLLVPEPERECHKAKFPLRGEGRTVSRYAVSLRRKNLTLIAVTKELRWRADCWEATFISSMALRGVAHLNEQGKVSSFNSSFAMLTGWQSAQGKPRI